MSEPKITRELIPTAQMKVDVSTNTREPVARDRLHRKMVDNWRPELCQDLEVAPGAEGVFEVIDGGTRLMAMRELGIASAWCRVHWDLRDNEVGDHRNVRAELFRAMARQRNPIKALEDFRALTSMGYEPAVAIMDALNRRDLMLSRYAKRVYPNAVSCSNALLQVHEWGVLEVTLDTSLAAWPTDSYGRSETIILGLAAALKNYDGRLRSDRLIARLSYHKPQGLIKAAKEMAATAGTVPWASLYDLVLLHYNHGLADALPTAPVPLITYRKPDAEYRPRFVGSSQRGISV